MADTRSNKIPLTEPDGPSHHNGGVSTATISHWRLAQLKESLRTGAPYPEALEAGSVKPEFQLEDHPVDDVRRISVAVIGAGISGILAGIFLPRKVPGLDLRIYEKNSDVGGTWVENIYPGVRCDVPAHAYQSSFCPNTNWTEVFAQGGEIREYWQGLARRYNAYKYIHFNHKVEKAEWLATETKWKITLRDLNDTSATRVDMVDFLITATGLFNYWKLPDYKGLDDFGGKLFHSSNWDPNFDATGKRVALIGNGSSGVQLLPELQKSATHVDHYIRNKTWIVSTFGGFDLVSPHPRRYTPEQQELFNKPQQYLEYRKTLESLFFKGVDVAFKDDARTAGLRKAWEDSMRDRVLAKPGLFDKMVPSYPPFCRRPTPGVGYLEAVSQDNVDLIQAPIEKFSETGIVTTDGVERQVDAVICATGAHVDCSPFPIIANGVDLKEAFKPSGVFGFPYTYLGLATPGFPNALWIGGPASVGIGGTLPHALENQMTYAAKVLRKFRSQGIKTMAPSKQAADDFVAYSDAFFRRTVFTDNDDASATNKNCSSWYTGGKTGGRVTSIFPGSATHVNYVRRDPRWEDWEYTYLSSSGNRFAYFGNGTTKKELCEDSDLTPYLMLPEKVDLRSHHEGWWDAL